MAAKSRKKLGTTPAADLPLDDRTKVVGTVRDIWAFLSISAAGLRARAERVAADGNVPALDPQQAHGLLSLAKTASALIDAHPGLLGIVDGSPDAVGKNSTIAGPDAERRLQEALDAGKPRRKG